MLNGEDLEEYVKNNISCLHFNEIYLLIIYFFETVRRLFLKNSCKIVNLESETFGNENINKIITNLKDKVKKPLKDLMLFSKIVKKKFSPNFYLLIQCVTNLIIFTELYHFLKRHNNCIYIFTKCTY